MIISRVANLLAIKYKFATSINALEIELSKKINLLWSYPNQKFEILRSCADSDAKNPKNALEESAVKGHEFARDLLSMIDYLKVKWQTSSVEQRAEVLSHIIDLISSNIGESVQFEDLSNLLMFLPTLKKHDKAKRDLAFSKIKIGLSRILDLSNDMLKDLNKIEHINPELSGHFNPQRAIISEKEIYKFIMEQGPKYNLNNIKDYQIVTEEDPSLKEKIFTVINALKRGHVPRDGGFIKDEIARILKEKAKFDKLYRGKINNFEQEDSPKEQELANSVVQDSGEIE